MTKDMKLLPTLFVSHGAPDLLLDNGTSHDSFEQLANSISTPNAILIVSAHWVCDPVGITDMVELETIHDFHGFQSELYQMSYPAQSIRELSLKVDRLLEGKGFNVQSCVHRGLDHETWVPLKQMYPNAEIPIVQVSLPKSSLDELVDFGNALRPLGDDGVLIIDSCGTVHNLREMKLFGLPEVWAIEFDEWLKDCIEGNQSDDLISADHFPDGHRRAHPTLEHYALNIVAWAAGDWEMPGRRMH